MCRAGERGRPAGEVFAAGQELQGRRVGRAFGFNKHGLHLAIDGAGIKGCALSPTPSHGGWPPPDWPETADGKVKGHIRSEEHTSELQSLMRISYAVFCLKKKKKHNKDIT